MDDRTIDVPGTTADRSRNLVERKTSTERSVDPGAGVGVSVLVDGRMVRGAFARTVHGQDPSARLARGFGSSVDMTKSYRIPTIHLQQTPAEKL